MPDDQTKTLSEIIMDTLNNWAGWPEAGWVVMTIYRKHRIPQTLITNKIAELITAKKIALVEHKGQAVLRME